VGPIEAVPAPADLVVVGRLRSPDAFAKTVSQWLNLPFSPKALLDKQFPAFRDLVRLDAPVEVAAGLDPAAITSPKLGVALSVGLTDYAAALERLRSKGMVLERVSKHMQFVALGDKLKCVVARANGVASARLVCSDTREKLDALAPYMSTALSTQELGDHDLVVRGFAQPFKDRFGKQVQWAKSMVPGLVAQLRQGDDRLDAAISDAVYAVATELVAVVPDVDGVELRLSAASQTNSLDLSLGVLFKSQNSWVARTVASRGGDSAPAPASFWRLPADVEAAFYSAASKSSERWTPLLNGAVELAGSGLVHLGAASKVFDELLQSVRGVGEEQGATVYAFGSAAPQKSAKTSDAPAYYLAGIEQPADSRTDLVERLVAAYNDKTWRAAAAKRLDAPALTKLPPARALPAPASLGLPAGARLHQLHVPAQTLELITQQLEADGSKDTPKSSKKTGAGRSDVKWSIIALRDGERSWVAWGPDEALIAAKLRAVLSGADDQVLGANPALQRFRTEPAAVAGFVTVVNALSRASSLILGPNGAMPVDQMRLVMPNQGRAPVRLGLDAETSGPQAWLTVGVPAQAMEDVAAGVVAIIAAGQDAF